VHVTEENDNTNRCKLCIARCAARSPAMIGTLTWRRQHLSKSASSITPTVEQTLDPQDGCFRGWFSSAISTSRLHQCILAQVVNPDEFHLVDSASFQPVRRWYSSVIPATCDPLCNTCRVRLLEACLALIIVSAGYHRIEVSSRAAAPQTASSVL